MSIGTPPRDILMKKPDGKEEARHKKKPGPKSPA
jgi:hypothetical protein